MSDYIKSLFDVIDGKMTYDKAGKKKRGRRPGYKHSKETKEKIAEKMRDRKKPEEVKSKISKSLRGRAKPDEVKEKISKSKTKHCVAEDLLHQYAGLTSERDVNTTTAEWLERCGYTKAELCQWIQDNYDDINEFDDICTESHLKALSIKEEAAIDQDFNFISEEWTR